MRMTLAVLFVLFSLAATGSAQADPYRWCAVYGGTGDAMATNCYFVTLEQCRAAVSGVGGLCQPNTFYDGRPVTTPEDVVHRGRPRGTR